MLSSVARLSPRLARPVSVPGAAVLLMVAMLTPSSASAMNIETVVSPGGIEAKLVRYSEVPLIAMQFGFSGGSVQDLAGKEGLAHFVSGMLDEGAADLDSMAFQERMEDAAVRLDFDAGRDVFSGSLQTLTANRDEAFELLRLALNEPRFDADAMERVRRQILTGIKFDKNDPRKVAAREWYKLAFAGHPYGRPVQGTAESVATIAQDDLKSYARHVFARDTLKIAVVGDIDPETLGKLLDKTFGALPAKADLVPVAEAEPPMGPRREVIPMDVPQSVAQFGHRGLKRKDKDFMASYVLNYILGGGGFSSRLMEEVREKRGLAYSVYSYLYPFKHGAIYVGNVATENKSVGRSLDVIQSELKRMAEEGPSAEELANAKQYLTGSYALRFDTSNKIASQLLWIQIDDLGDDYIATRNAQIEAVTLDDIKRVALRLLKADALIVTIVGQPLAAEKSKS